MDRECREDDQERIEECISILNVVCGQIDYEAALIVSAMWSMIANGYKNTGYPYEHFLKENMEMVKHMKYLWEE